MMSKETFLVKKMFEENYLRGNHLQETTKSLGMGRDDHLYYIGQTDIASLASLGHRSSNYLVGRGLDFRVCRGTKTDQP